MLLRYILTGAPGAGKTVLIRHLEQQGYDVVDEAATDIIALEQANGVAEPWRHPSFTQKIARLQCRRQAAPASGPLQFHDRSLFCTLALARYLGHEVPSLLDQAIRQSLAEDFFEKRVFFVRLLGFITPTEARRISLEDSMRFERVHEQVYREFGFELVFIDPCSIADRAAAIFAASARD